MDKVLLVCMPFASTKWPSIGVSLLKTEVERAGFGCDVRYLNMLFAHRLGLDLYEEIAIYSRGLMGEWIFAESVFPDALPSEAEYWRYLDNLPSENSTTDRLERDRILGCRQAVPGFLDECLSAVDWSRYHVIGFTSMFEQNMASLALAKRLKAALPAAVVVFGGANVDGDMGAEMHSRFPFIDYICRGEADNSFPLLVGSIFRGEAVDGIPGLVYRGDGGTCVTTGVAVVEDLDEIPFPDYSDYFQQLRRDAPPEATCYEIQMESARGCWWGEKAKCRFCGLNKRNIGFRTKSPRRVREELRHLTEEYLKDSPVGRVSMVDNVFAREYFETLLPDLVRDRLPVELFYEVKANLTREQVRLLKDAGIVWVQPGIESLSSHVLRLMGKGITALENLRLLKYCAEAGVYPTWNLIYGIPGETARDYTNSVALINKSTHLVPPEGLTPLCLQRFSRYFDEPERYGLRNVRPEKSYRYVFPFDLGSLRRLSYFFDFDPPDNGLPSWCQPELREAVARWRGFYDRGEFLRSRQLGPESLLIEDGRTIRRVETVQLSEVEAVVYGFCDDVRSIGTVVSYLRGYYHRACPSLGQVSELLEEMVWLNLMAREEDKFLSLAVHVQSPVASEENS